MSRKQSPSVTSESPGHVRSPETARTIATINALSSACLYDNIPKTLPGNGRESSWTHPLCVILGGGGGCFFRRPTLRTLLFYNLTVESTTVSVSLMRKDTPADWQERHHRLWAGVSLALLGVHEATSAGAPETEAGQLYFDL